MAVSHYLLMFSLSILFLFWWSEWQRMLQWWAFLCDSKECIKFHKLEQCVVCQGLKWLVIHTLYRARMVFHANCCYLTAKSPFFPPPFVFLGMFAKLQKATVSFAMSVRLSVHTHETTWLPLDRFHEICYLSIFWKSVKEIEV
jgi:hypothetical protein